MGRHQRIAELARIGPPEGVDRPRLEVADVATGQGRTARAILTRADATDTPIRLHAVDAGVELDDDLLHDARVRAVLTDLDEPLPFAESSLDRMIHLNVAEHLADPAASIADCHRTLRPGGLLVLAHSDWDTVVFASDDDRLTRRLVDRFVDLVPSWAQRSDGFMGRKLLGLAVDSPFELVGVETWADCHRRFDDGSVAWKVAHGTVAAVADDPALAETALDWLESLRRLSGEGRFLFTVTDVAIVLRKPA